MWKHIRLQTIAGAIPSVPNATVCKNPTTTPTQIMTMNEINSEGSFCKMNELI
jgi:hypothetical protein